MSIKIDNKPFFEQLTIVLIGNFNPAIFHPMWFAKNELIMDQEAENASIKINNMDICVFTLDWCVVEVLKNRFSIKTIQEQTQETIKDLVVSTFLILNHTPINMLGINIDREYDAKDESTWHNIGHALTPKDIWKNILNEPGMKNIVIQGKREDSYEGHIQFSVSPGNQQQHSVSIGINDHYQGKDLECDKILGNWNSILLANKKKLDRLIDNLQKS